MAKRTAIGALIIEFYKDGWPDGYIHDAWDLGPGVENFVDGLEPLKMYPLSNMGDLFEDDGEDVLTFGTAFNRWLRTRDSTTLLVTIPNKDFEELQSLAKAKKWKIQ